MPYVIIVALMFSVLFVAGLGDGLTIILNAAILTGVAYLIRKLWRKVSAKTSSR
jgi:hypothetical protein